MKTKSKQYPINYIKTWRKLRGITQEEMSRFLNVNISHISRIENAKTNITDPMAIQIASILNISKSSLFVEPDSLDNTPQITRGVNAMMTKLISIIPQLNEEYLQKLVDYAEMCKNMQYNQSFSQIPEKNIG